LADVWPQRVNPEDLMRLAIQGIERWTQDGS